MSPFLLILGSLKGGLPPFPSSLIVEIFGLPDLPDLSGQIRSRLESRLAGTPLRRTGLTLVLAHVLEGIDLTQEFVDVAAYRGIEHLNGLNNAIRVNKETTSQIKAQLFVIDAVKLADLPGHVPEEREGNTTRDQLGKLGLLPDFMGKDRISTDRKDFYPTFLELVITGRDRGELRRSDKGKIRRVEEDDHPLPPVVGKLHRFDFPIHIGLRFKLRRGNSWTYTHNLPSFFGFCGYLEKFSTSVNIFLESFLGKIPKTIAIQALSKQ